MDMQNVSNLVIPEGNVRTIHDKDNKLIWGRLAYDTKYAGNTIQNGVPTLTTPINVDVATGAQTVTVTRKNLVNPQTFVDWIELGDSLCEQYNWGDASTRPKYGTWRGRSHVVSWVASTLYDKRDQMINPTYDEFRMIIPNNGQFKENTQYTISFDAEQSYAATSVAFNLGVRYTDNSSSYIYITTPNEWVPLKLTTMPNKTIKAIQTVISGGTSYIDLDTLQIEEGEATAYEPYQSANYTVNLGSTELCKIGTYQDYIYKSGSDWYVHKAIDKHTMLSTDNYYWSAGDHRVYTDAFASTIAIPDLTEQISALSSKFVPLTMQALLQSSEGFACYTTGNVSFRNNSWNSVDNARTAIIGTVVYYALATPTDTKITDATLIAQLDAVHQFLTRYGYNGTVSGNLPIIIDRTSL